MDHRHRFVFLSVGQLQKVFRDFIICVSLNSYDFFFASAFQTLGKLGFYSGSFSLKIKVFIPWFSISCLGSGDEEEGGGSSCHYAKQVLLWVFPYHGCSGEERSGGTFLLHW